MKRICYCVAIGAALLSISGCQTVTEQRLAEEYYNLGNVFFDLEQYDRAVEQYNRALTIDRNFSRAEYNLAFSYLELDRYDDARTLLDQLKLADPENLLILESDAYLDYVQGEVEQATEKYKAVIEIDPQRANALYNLALIHYTAEEYEEADSLLETVYRINDEDPLVTYYYILTKRALEQPDEDIRQLAQDILTREWDDNAKLLQLGILLEELRYFPDANSAYQKIVQTAPQHAEALFRIGRISLIAISDPQAGFDNIEQALEDGFRGTELFVSLYQDERLLQKRQIEELFQKYEINITSLEEQVLAQRELEEQELEEQARAEQEADETPPAELEQDASETPPAELEQETSEAPASKPAQGADEAPPAEPEQDASEAPPAEPEPPVEKN